MRCRRLVFAAAVVLSFESLGLASAQNAGLSNRHESVILVRVVEQGFNYVTPWKRASRGAAEHWSRPAISGGRLYISHGDALICYEIKAR